MKKVIILILLICLLATGCEKQEKKYPVTKVECTNQTVWENRVNYEDFRCEMSNAAKFPIFRNCTATDYVMTSISDFVKVEINIRCIERCFENCQNGWKV